MENLEIFNKVRSVPQEAIKLIMGVNRIFVNDKILDYGRERDLETDSRI